MNKTDYIIVGAGSAGCVLANRLSADASVSVTLIEAGKWDRNPFIHMPAGYFALMKTGIVDWGYYSTPQPTLYGRTLYCPRGKVIGGSSSVNGMVYVRGHPTDYDQWAQQGNIGWSYEDCLPFFNKAEGCVIPGLNARGKSGPIKTSRYGVRHPYSVAFVAACQEMGINYSDDINSGEQEGVAPLDSSMDGPYRSSSATAYLHPVRSRKNLTILTRTFVSRVVVHEGRTVGVEIIRNGSCQTIFCSREVILSGGAVNSPTILQLSGIGDPEDLKRAGVTLRHALRGVGKNLQDHPGTVIKQLSSKPLSLYPHTKLARAAWSLAQYILTRSGQAAYHGIETQAFLRTRDGLAAPDIQSYMINLMYGDSGRKIIQKHGFMVIITLQRPASRGHIRIASNNPQNKPQIDLNYFEKRTDIDTLIDGLKLCRKIVSQHAFDSVRSSELTPGTDAQTDADLEQYVRNEAFSNYHLSGTCKMGPSSDPSAVVDSQLRVHGITGLRVIDASIMPSIVSGNTNAATIMIAEKGASLIQSDNRPFLAPEIGVGK